MIRKIISNSIILFCFYVYLFPFKAYGFEPRIIVFLIYLILYFKPNNIKLIKIPLHYNKILYIPILVGITSILTLCINGTMDLAFVIYPFQIIYLLLLSYCIFKIIIYYTEKISFEVLSIYFIRTLLLQAFITITMFVNPTINDILFNLQGIDETSWVIEMYKGKRLIGLGCFYFGGGLIYGLGLIIIMSLLLNNKSKRNSIFLMFEYILVFIVGICIARTCLVGAAISFMMVFINIFRRKISKQILNICFNFFIFILTITFSLVFIYSISPKIQDEYGMIIDFGFEAFINYAEEGKLETASSEGLKTLYNWPTETKTYFIGDGRFTGDNGDGYYKHTDVGYLRLIYYFGLFGLLLIILQNWYILNCLKYYWTSPKIHCLSIVLFIYFLLLNLKGYIDLTPYLFLYLHCHLYNLSKKHEAKKNYILS